MFCSSKAWLCASHANCIPYSVLHSRTDFSIFLYFCVDLADSLVSGETPQEPVLSVKTGHVYERRLIEKYITESGVCPITGQSLSVSDLVSVKCKHSLAMEQQQWLTSWIVCECVTSQSNCSTQSSHCNFATSPFAFFPE